MIRFQVVLTHEEEEALNKLAERDMRQIRDQAHFLLRQELVKCGLLHEEPVGNETIVLPKGGKHA